MITITADFAYLVGAILGDGYVAKRVYRRRYEIAFASKDYNFIYAFQNSYLRVFGKHAAVAYVKNNESRIYRITASNKTLNLFLRQPLEMVLHVLKPVAMHFVRGFYDAEGSASTIIRKGRNQGQIDRHISFYNTNRKLLAAIHSILLTEGIHPSPSIYNVTSKNQNKTMRKPCFAIRIQRKADVALFTRKIVSSIPRKNLGVGI